MKNIILLLSFIACFNSCDKNDDNNCAGVDCLPPATQTGENTFGALLDGEPFIPAGGNNPLDCVYQLINGERFFGLQGNKRNEDSERIMIALGTQALELESGVTYDLLSEENGNSYGLLSVSSIFNFTSAQNPGELTITKLDLNNQIVAGTFFFDVIDQNGQLRQIRNGRFDMRFTQ